MGIFKFNNRKIFKFINWKRPVMASSIIAIIATNSLAAYLVYRSNIKIIKEAWLFYAVVLIIIVIQILYNYTGGVLIEVKQHVWLKDFPRPKFEKGLRILILFFVQVLFGFSVTFFSNNPEWAISTYLISISILYLCWDLLLKRIGRNLPNIQETFNRFIICDGLFFIGAAITSYILLCIDLQSAERNLYALAFGLSFLCYFFGFSALNKHEIFAEKYRRGVWPWQ